MDGPFVDCLRVNATGLVYRDRNTMVLCLIDTQLEYLLMKSAGSDG